MSTTTINNSLHSTQELVKEALSSASEWQTIDSLVAICDEAGCWQAGFAQRAITNAKKLQIRKVVSNLKDKDGFPLFPSITVLDDEGKRKRVYKQELLFDVEDYKTVVNYHARLSNHHRDMAEGYVERCKEKHEVQLSLWDLGEDFDDQLDGFTWRMPRFRRQCWRNLRWMKHEFCRQCRQNYKPGQAQTLRRFVRSRTRFPCHGLITTNCSPSTTKTPAGSTRKKLCAAGGRCGS